MAIVCGLDIHRSQVTFVGTLPMKCRSSAREDDAVSGDDACFPEHEYPSDFELWLESDGVVRIRSGIKIIELESTDARDLGLALIELADSADRD